MKKIKLLAVIMVLAMTMTMFTGCLDETGSTSNTSGGTTTVTDDYDDDEDYDDYEDEDDSDNSETLNTSGSSTSSGSSSSSGSSTLSDREICEKVYNYAIANQKYDDLDGVTAKRSLSRTSVYRDAGDTCLVGLDVDFYEGGEAGSGVLDIYWCNKKTGQIKYIDSFQDGPGDGEIDMRTGAYHNPYSSSSSGSSTSTSGSISESGSNSSNLSEDEILRLVYNYAVKNQHYEPEDGLYYKRSLEDTYMEIDEGDTCLVGVSVGTYESPDFDEDTAFDGATDGYWFNKKTGEIKYIGSYQDDPRYFVDMATGTRKNV